MSKEIDVERLTHIIAERGAAGRSITAIAGAPGSGKSTLAEDIVYALNARESGSAAIFPMDGFHYDDLLLIPRGLRPRKGVPLVHSSSRGDELVTVRVVIPQTLTARQKELLKEFADIERQQLSP